MNQSKFLLLFGSLLLVCLVMFSAMNINDVHGHNIGKLLRLSSEYDETQKIKAIITIRDKLTYQILTGTNESDFSNKATQKIPLLVSFYIFSKHIKPFTPKKNLYSPNNRNQILIYNNQKHIASSIKNLLPFSTFQLDTSFMRS